VVENLLKAGADIEAGDGEAGTALHLAASYANGVIMDVLIDRKANVNAISRKTGPVINAAILSGSVDAVKRILTPDIRFDLDYTAFYAPLSLSAGHLEPSVFNEILQLGRDKWVQNHTLIDQAIIFAAEAGRLESVQVLLNFQHIFANDVLVKAMECAAYGKKWPVVSTLLEFMAKRVPNNVTTSDIMLGNVFYVAAIHPEDQIAIMDQIWSFPGYDLPDPIRDFSMYQATALKKNPTVDWLLFSCEADANTGSQKPSEIDPRFMDVDSFDDFINPLNAAAKAGNGQLVESLVRAGARIDDDQGYSLHLAASEGHLRVAEALLEHGAAIDRQAPDSDTLAFYQGTALQAACESNKVEVVDMLLRRGANPNIGGGIFTNPITAATRKAEPEILELLLGAQELDVNATGGENSSTPLINAATNMSFECVELLVRRGADVNARNAEGDTALIMAAWKGEAQCVEMLCENGADVTYRSPRQGLAIEVASKRSHVKCAHLLAQRMNRLLLEYYEQGTSRSSVYDY
jgi:ankyrin repeat protein